MATPDAAPSSSSSSTSGAGWPLMIDSALLRPSLALFLAAQVRRMFRAAVAASDGESAAASVVADTFAPSTGEQSAYCQMHPLPAFIRQIGAFLWDFGARLPPAHDGGDDGGDSDADDWHESPQPQSTRCRSTRIAVGQLMQALYYLHRLRAAHPEATASTPDACHRLPGGGDGLPKVQPRHEGVVRQLVQGAPETALR